MTSQKIGITIFAREATATEPSISFWSCGAHMNCVFLAMCLRAAGHDVRMIYDGPGAPPDDQDIPQAIRGFSWQKISDQVLDDLDVLIQAGAQVSVAHVTRIRDRGGRAIAFKFGSDYPIDAERSIHDLPSGAIFNGAQFDEVWTTDQHIEVCGAYWEICYRVPVRVLPHLWHPCFVDQMCEEMKKIDLPSGYKPGREKKRIVILEPNIQLLKTFHIAALACEYAWRHVPQKIESVLVTNAERLKGFEAFKMFVANLDLIKTKSADGHPIISFEPRYNTPWFLSAYGDVVVSHQWIAVPNYSHYDAIHLGFPIVHNVPELERWNVGYYYPKFDAREGGRQLWECLMTHDQFFEDDQRNARHFLQTRLADSPTNVEAHARALEELWKP